MGLALLELWAEEAMDDSLRHLLPIAGALNALHPQFAVVLACLRALVAICGSYACITHNMICTTTMPMGNRV